MRRNIILAVATVTVMVLIGGFLAWKSSGGGNGDLPGVTVSEDGDTPTVTIDDAEVLDGDVEAGTAKAAVLTEGDGAKLETGDFYRAAYIIVDADTGEEMESTYNVAATDGSDETTTESVVFEYADPDSDDASGQVSMLPTSMFETMKDLKVGSTIVMAARTSDLSGTEPADGEDDPVLVFYFEILESLDTSADAAPSGTESDLPDGVPTPEVDGDTVTGFDGSGATEPATEAAHVMIKGDGAEVEATDYVYANYLGEIYPDGEVFDSSYERGEPSLFSLGSVIPCWTDMLTGQTVGSRVVLTCPADVAYGDTGSTDGTIAAGDSLTFVVDIVGAI